MGNSPSSVNIDHVRKTAIQVFFTVFFLLLAPGEEDNVNSPSARLVMGALPRGGTGSFDLILDTKMQSEREEHEAARAKKRVSKKF
ncbi:hypothetical protein B9Z55_006644 [Caenorhabditis nigoni]|uniref:Uncharacterized protein n=1 Tax=Caenorhabditis nigoni TaxID=1611254 RepID=A0A2G5V638_9PELO|nr:hypothetical protein B9Z55_006644 [Caenorhabditis nigoni]